ncbi:MAG TPA: ATP-binding protein [Chitinophagaceae bacterium]|nr:ATP-binding protein [Chitinophagaceae bacterium]
MNDTDSYSALIFLYNIQHKEILFSSLSFQLFFGSSPDLQDDPVFIKSFAGNDTESLLQEWQASLHLKEKENRKFSFISNTSDGNPFLFDFNVFGISLPSFSDESLLLVYVKKVLLKGATPVNDKSASDYQKDYAEFIELAVHDLDAPLRKLSVLIDKMTAKIDPVNDIYDYTTRIQACLSDMRSMIDSLSTLAGLAGVKTQHNSCDIEKIVREAIYDLQKEKQNKIVIVSSSLPAIHGDCEQYKQLIRNLLLNAIRFSKKDILPAIEIKSELVKTEEIKKFNLEQNKVYFKITIADNGIGFRQEYAEIIFNPFVRLNGKSEYPGNGIGLAICKKIVENHHGIIYAEGDENKGARIILILPQAN